MDQRGVEPLAMKIFAGIVLLVIGLGIGYGVFVWVGGYARALRCEISFNKSSTTIGRPGSDTIVVTVEYLMGERDNVTLKARGVPSGVQVSFNPSGGGLTLNSKMVISVDNTAAPVEDHPITVYVEDSRGNECGSKRFDLTIQ